jgi:hypothetical protein
VQAFFLLARLGTGARLCRAHPATLAALLVAVFRPDSSDCNCPGVSEQESLNKFL